MTIKHYPSEVVRKSKGLFDRKQIRNNGLIPVCQKYEAKDYKVGVT